MCVYLCSTALCSCVCNFPHLDLGYILQVGIPHQKLIFDRIETDLNFNSGWFLSMEETLDGIFSILLFLLGGGFVGEKVEGDFHGSTTFKDSRLHLVFDLSIGI